MTKGTKVIFGGIVLCNVIVVLYMLFQSFLELKSILLFYFKWSLDNLCSRKIYIIHCLVSIKRFEMILVFILLVNEWYVSTLLHRQTKLVRFLKMQFLQVFITFSYSKKQCRMLLQTGENIMSPSLVELGR